MNLDPQSGTPVYQQLVDGFARRIAAGSPAAGERLPTVRELARQLDISKGTVKHAYDTLEQLGMIEKSQGRGTFVSHGGHAQEPSRKKQALALIDNTLDALGALGFSANDSRIFLDLKLREREAAQQNLRVGVVDCSPEALSVLSGRVAALPGVDTYDYLLEDVLSRQGQFDPPVDMLITTPAHSADIEARLAPGLELVQLVLAPALQTVSLLSRIPHETKVGILCRSRRFAGVIARACSLYCTLASPPAVQLFGGAKATKAFLKKVDLAVLPHGYIRFCRAEELELLRGWGQAHTVVEYRYEVERGSLVYLREEIERRRRGKNNALN